MAVPALAQGDGDRPVKPVTPVPVPSPLPALPENFDPAASFDDPPASGRTTGEDGRKVPVQVATATPGLEPLSLPSDGEAIPDFPGLPALPDGTAATLPTGPETDLLPQDPDAPEGGAPSADRPPAPRRAGPEGAPEMVEWHMSPYAARALAKKTGRCHLLVFSTKVGIAGNGVRQLNSGVFLTPEFNELANKSLVLSYLDYTPQGGITTSPEEIKRADAMKAIKEALKVRGYPTVILFGPDGVEIDRWSGFNSSRKRAYFERLRQAVEGHNHVLNEVTARRQRLTGEGYRMWRSAAGSEFFGKLVEFDARVAVLRDEAGADHRVNLQQLSLIDRELITRQRLGKPVLAPVAGTPPAPATPPEPKRSQPGTTVP